MFEHVVFQLYIFSFQEYYEDQHQPVHPEPRHLRHHHVGDGEGRMLEGS